MPSQALHCPSLLFVACAVSPQHDGQDWKAQFSCFRCELPLRHHTSTTALFYFFSGEINKRPEREREQSSFIPEEDMSYRYVAK